MSQRIRFYGLSYSPWTERARWAFDHHRIPHQYHEHTPVVGELRLRSLSKGTGQKRATVPLVQTASKILGDSLEIMRYADEVGTGQALIREGVDAAGWATKLEPILQRVRMRVSRRTLADPAALEEAASSLAPKPIAKWLKPVAVIGIRHLARKYDFNLRAEDSDYALIKEALEELREQLGDKTYLYESFSAADILAATFLQVVRPPQQRYISLSPALFRTWEYPELAEQYADLLSWRDALYHKHRTPSA